MPGVTIQRTGLLFVDSFDHLADGQFNRKWTSVVGGGTRTASGRTGYGLRTGTWYAAPSITLGGVYPTLYAGVAYYTGVFANHIIRFTGTVPGFTVTVSIANVGDGRVRADTTGWGTKSGPISIFSMNSDTWYFWELTATLYPVAGAGNASVSYIIRVNNVAILSGTITGLTSTYADKFTASDFGGPGGGYTAVIDDVYVGDSTCGFLGDTQWGVIRPNGEGFYQDFVPNAGAVHYDRINEITPDDDTTYLYSSTPGDDESEDYEDIVATGPIVGIHCNLILKKDATGECSAKMRLYDGVNPDWLDADVFLPSEVSYYDYTYGFKTNPLTTLAWTEAAVNGLQLSVRRHT